MSINPLAKNFLKLRPRSQKDRGSTRFLKFFASGFFYLFK